MALIIVIWLVAVGALVAITLVKGFEQALPFAAFLVVVLPAEARIDIGNLFMLTTTRVVIAMLAILFVAFGNRNRKTHQSDKLPLKFILLSYLAWCLVSTLNSAFFATSVKTAISIVLDFYVLYYVFSKSVSSVETIHKILSACVAALVVCCIVGFVERYTSWKVVNLFPAVSHRFTPGEGGLMGDAGRITSTFPHAILFANALTLGVPWVLYLLGVAKTAAQRFYLWVAIIMMFYNLYKTQSRGPWLALGLSLLLLLLFSAVSIRKYLVVLSLLTVSALIIRPGVWDTLRNTYFETLDADSPRGSSYQYRYELMHAGRQALAQDFGRSLWGFGPESFYYLGLEAEVPGTGKIEKLESCDSSVVDIMIGTGYVGLFLVAALFINACLFSLRAYLRMSKPANLLCLIFLINLLAYAFMMASVMNFGWGQQSYMLWIILALSMIYPGLVQSKNRGKDLAVFSWHETGPQLVEVSQG